MISYRHMPKSTGIDDSCLPTGKFREVQRSLEGLEHYELRRSKDDEDNVENQS